MQRFPKFLCGAQDSHSVFIAESHVPEHSFVEVDDLAEAELDSSAFVLGLEFASGVFVDGLHEVLEVGLWVGAGGDAGEVRGHQRMIQSKELLTERLWLCKCK